MKRVGRFSLMLVWASASFAWEAPRYLGPPPPPRPGRVVTLAPSLTETVVALGAAQRLVGVSRFDTLPEVKDLPRVGGFVDPSVEAVVALHPDLVVVQPGPGNQRPVEKMAELGFPVLALPLHSVAQVLEGIRALGRALGLPERGDSLARALEQHRDVVRTRAKGRPSRRVLFVYGFDPLVVAGPGSFADELLKDAGGQNAAVRATEPYAAYSMENALAARPDIVIDASNSVEGQRFHDLAPFSRARWVTLSSEHLLHPGPRLSEGLDDLFAALHGEGDAGR